MKVFLRNIKTGDEHEIVVPPLHQIEIELEGPVPGRGAKSVKRLALSDWPALCADDGEDLGIHAGEDLGIHVGEGLLRMRAPSANILVIEVTG